MGRDMGRFVSVTRWRTYHLFAHRVWKRPRQSSAEAKRSNSSLVRICRILITVIPPSPCGFYVNRIRWIRFDLLTQIPDMDGNRVAGAVIVRFLPDCFIEPLWRENLSAVGKQQLQNLMVTTKILSYLQTLSVWDMVHYSMQHRQWYLRFQMTFTKYRLFHGMITKIHTQARWLEQSNILLN